jgi:hypothetical protein
MNPDTPRTDAAKVDKGGMTFVWVEFAQQLERELTASLENQYRAQEKIKKLESTRPQGNRHQDNRRQGKLHPSHAYRTQENIQVL